MPRPLVATTEACPSSPSLSSRGPPQDVQRCRADRGGSATRLRAGAQADSKPQRREAARDASGMANASGGLLVYGVEETTLSAGQVVPKGPKPMADHGLRDRLENILDSTVSPRMR